MNVSHRWVAALALTWVLAGCLDQTPLDPTLWEHLDLVEDSVVLDARVTYLGGAPLPVLAAENSVGGGGAGYAMKQVARVISPVAAGVGLQASHIVRNGGKVFVAYNVRGDVFRGGIDVFEKVDKEDPVLKAQAVFYDSEISAIDLDGGDLYMATATADESFRTPAVLEVMSVGGGKSLASAARVDLSSFAGTGVKFFDQEIYVTSGSSGDVAIFDRSLKQIFSDPLPDARAIDVNKQYIVAMRGTPGMLRVYDRGTRTILRDIPLGGASTPNSKSSVILLDDLAFAAAGDGGVVVANVATGQVVERLAAPAGPGVSVSNGLAWHNELLFVANGEGGLWIAEAVKDLDKLKGGAPGFRVVGRVDLTGSANFVDVKGDLLFVATGLAGLTIVEFDN